MGVYLKTMAPPPIPDDLRPLTATELRWKEYETFSQAYNNAKFVDESWFKSWCIKHNPVYVNAPCNLSPTVWFRALLECYHKETTTPQNRHERETISFHTFADEKPLPAWVGRRPVSGPTSHLQHTGCFPGDRNRMSREVQRLSNQVQIMSLNLRNVVSDFRRNHLLSDVRFVV